MSDVIADLRRDLEGRLKQVEARIADLEPLVREQAQLKEALARPPFTTTKPAEAAPERVAPRPPKRKPRAAAKRAPRGANLDAILKAVDQRPGATAAEIADVTKIGRAVTYNTLAKLVGQGKLIKTALPGGQTGYRPKPQES